MQTIDACFEIVTPMFICGGDNEVELRPPSIKGALRFWWRALHWGQCLHEAKQNNSAALKLLHQREAALFGAAAKDDKYGQGKLQLRLILDKNLKDASLTQFSIGQTYLLGQGLYHFRDGLLKKALDADQSFIIRLKLADDVEPEAVINTLILWGLLGGLGSRSRKGWGAVAIRSLVYKKTQNHDGLAIEIPSSIDAYKTKIKELLVVTASSLPPFTAFSTSTRIDLSKTGTKALSLLGDIGLEMQRYRSYGRLEGGEHKVAGERAEQNFDKSDHDVVLDFANGTSITAHPKRVIFGLPHNYFFSDESKVDVIAVDSKIPRINKERQHRRASPLFIHIHKFPSGEYIAVQSLVKSDFLPDYYNIQLENTTKKSSRKGQANEVSCSIDWNVITQYLDRFTTKETII